MRTPLRRGVAAIALSVVSAGLVAVSAPAAHAQATRTWVSGVGDDVNPCSRTAPCKTWAGAISKTATGGIISALDSGGFGSVTITKSITLDGTGVSASTLGTGTDGIRINNPEADVVLRHLDINGADSVVGCTSGDGVEVIAAASVRLDDVRIANFTNAVRLDLGTANPDLFVDVTVNNLDAANNCNAGILATPSASRRARLVLSGSSISTSHQALVVGAGAEAWVAGSSLSLNDVALVSQGGARITDMCGNTLVGNATESTFTHTAAACTPPPPPAPTTPPSPTPTPTPTSTPATTPTVAPPATPPAPAPATYCVVPQLKGLTLTRARTALTRAGCELGKVTKVEAPRRKRGDVLAQTVPARVEVRPGTEVAVRVGR